jgi:enoyl-[acyl-carrier protein] reductase I
MLAARSGSAASSDKKQSPSLPAVKAKLLEGKKGLIVGMANENSIAWGCAKAFRALGADLAVTYLNDKAKKFVEPLAKVLDARIVMPLDVNTPGQMEAVFNRIEEEWDNLDFVVHSIAFSPKDALQGRVVDVSREGFATTMDVSCWTFIRMAHLAEPLMHKGGTLFTMSYYGSQMVVKNYNIMGVAKAALESAVRYMAAELGPKGIRVNAISPGPLATRAASGQNLTLCLTKRRRRLLHVAWSASMMLVLLPPFLPVTPPISLPVKSSTLMVAITSSTSLGAIVDGTQIK